MYRRWPLAWCRVNASCLVPTVCASLPTVCNSGTCVNVDGGTFSCDCDGTGYTGQFCEQSKMSNGLVTEPGGPTEHPLPPPPPHQEPSTMVPKCTLGCPEHNLTCSPDSHWDALELQPFAQGYLLAFTWALTERRSLMRHLNHLCIIVLWHNGPNVPWNILGDSFPIV